MSGASTDGPAGRAMKPGELDPKLSDPKLYVAHTLGMRCSHAWCGLPDIARRVLDRLEVEHLVHRLKQNGRLFCRYDDLEAWGMRRASVRLGVEIAAALGFIEITRRGWKSIPSTYRLTYVKSFKDQPPVTDEWTRFRTAKEVRDAIRGVMAALDREKANKKARADNAQNRIKVTKDRNSPGHVVTL